VLLFHAQPTPPFLLSTDLIPHHQLPVSGSTCGQLLLGVDKHSATVSEVELIGGVAMFANLAVDKKGVYFMRFSFDPGLRGVTGIPSASLDTTPGPGHLGQQWPAPVDVILAESSDFRVAGELKASSTASLQVVQEPAFAVEDTPFGRQPQVLSPRTESQKMKERRDYTKEKG
jgi:hypothetical protein